VEIKEKKKKSVTMMKKVKFLYLYLFLFFAIVSCSQFKKISTGDSQKKLDIISSETKETKQAVLEARKKSSDILKWCQALNNEIKNYGWRINPCVDQHWKIGGYSVEGWPLLYWESGNNKNHKNRSLILSMVHSDEVTPLYMALKLIEWLKTNPDLAKNKHIVIAPLVNPDGFFKKNKSRVNARGVDLNRNFNTSDWTIKALKTWRNKTKSHPRRFPGWSPSSEPETVFQEQLIKKFSPDKVLSIHAPLNYFDYDGPNVLSLEKFPKDYVLKCLKLRKSLNAISGGYYPGSLGNYMGKERGVPTITLELPTSKAEKAISYWKKFRQGIEKVIRFNIDSSEDLKT